MLVDWIPGGSHVEITCIATKNLAQRKPVNPAGFRPEPIAASAGVWAGDTLYLSGSAGVGDGFLAKGLDEQVRQIAKNQIAILNAAGLSLEDIVSGHVYLNSMDDYQGMNTIYREYFSKGPGVRTTLMPNKMNVNSEGRVIAAFIAARTEPAAASNK